jgi:hypothetical protein
MNFADFYSLDDFKKVSQCRWWRASKYESYKRKDKGPLTAEEQEDQKRLRDLDNKDQEVLREHKKTVFLPAMQAFFTAMREAGLMTPITGINGREISFAENWNRFISGGMAAFKDYEQTWLFSEFESAFLVYHLVRVEGKRELDPCADYSDELVKATYEKMIAAVNNGNLEEYEGIRDLYDGVSGDRITCSFNNWVPSLVKFDMKVRDYVPILDLEEKGVQTVEIDVPTGQLLISDWFRIDGFREATEAAYEDSGEDYSDHDDINSSDGAVNRSKKYAAGNIAHVQTTNTYCGIERTEDGKLGIAQRWSLEINEDNMTEEQLEDEAFDVRLNMPSEPVGEFSCDLWWLTALDRTVLIEHLKAGGNANAEKALDDYLNSKEAYSRNIVQLNVKPGRWKVHFGSRRVNDSNSHEASAFMVQGDQFGFDKRPHFWAVLEPVED